ncbi:uncharacterized protein [Cebidichthys violaceus]|uniref:uncharacterized protein n=1 Tax=Cebidichthys violaceus TaxID=271503 RepID=UPI0035CC2E17
MMTPKPPRTKCPMKSTITSSFDVGQLAYEDRDEPVPAVTDGSQSEVKVKPVPRPRSRIQPKSQCNNNNNDTVDYADTTSNTTSVVSSQLSEYPADYKTPLPVRPPPPRPPRSKCLISRKPTIDRGNHYMTSVSEPTNPAVNSERTQSPAPRPERPPPPSISYSSSSTMTLKSESDSDEGLQSSSPHISFVPQSPVSPALSNEEVNLCGTYSTTATERPAVPPRPGQSSLVRSDSLGGTSSPQTRPPPPSFFPPPPPELEEPEDTDVLPEDVDKMSLGRPTAGYQTGHYSPHQQTTEDAENPAVNSERTQSPAPRPERPPPPSISYSSSSTMTLKSESDSDEGLQSSSPHISFVPQSPVSPALSNEEVNLCGTYSTTATERPAVPPRPGQSSLVRSDSLGGTSSPQTRPPPPSFSPPPPPEPEEPEEPSDTMYSEIEHRPYLDVLPEDVDKMSLGRPTAGYQTGHYSPHQQTTEDAEDINGLLRWLKRVSKYDGMASSVYGLSIEEEIRSLSQRAVNVRKALRLYNLLMMKRKESLRDLVTEFSSISDSLDKMKKKGKSMDIAGGTTGAIGGVTAVLGIAFAPATLGASLIATAVGVGMVASAGGIGARSAMAKKKIVNRMTVEKLVYDYKGNVVDLEHCLGFILSGMNELQRHDIARLQRAGAQPDSLKMAHLSQFVLKNNTTKDRGTSLTHTCGLSSERLLLAFAKEMDQYFTENDGQTLKKSSKSKFSGRVRLLSKNLQEELFHLNRMWEMFG